MVFYNKYIRKSVIIRLLFFTFFLLLISLINYSFAYSQETFNTSNNEEVENINKSIVDFAEDIYKNYSSENFQYIYNVLHPDIKRVLGEDDYIEFQKKNFNRYKIEIKDINVLLNLKKIDLAVNFRNIIEENGNMDIYKIKVIYKMKFIIAGNKQERQTEKDVIIGSENQRLYLIWDPSVIND